MTFAAQIVRCDNKEIDCQVSVRKQALGEEQTAAFTNNGNVHFHVVFDEPFPLLTVLPREDSAEEQEAYASVGCCALLMFDWCSLPWPTVLSCHGYG